MTMKQGCWFLGLWAAGALGLAVAAGIIRLLLRL
jgi:hypothetical protein